MGQASCKVDATLACLAVDLYLHVGYITFILWTFYSQWDDLVKTKKHIPLAYNKKGLLDCSVLLCTRLSSLPLLLFSFSVSHVLEGRECLPHPFSQRNDRLVS